MLRRQRVKLESCKNFVDLTFRKLGDLKRADGWKDIVETLRADHLQIIQTISACIEDLEQDELERGSRSTVSSRSSRRTGKALS